MTFWQDARPASPRFRMPQRAEIVTQLVASKAARRLGGASRCWWRRSASRSCAAGGETPRRRRHGPAVPRRAEATRASCRRSGRGRCPTGRRRCSPTAADVIVIGDNWVSSVALDDGRLRWQAVAGDVEPGRCGVTRCCSALSPGSSRSTGPPGRFGGGPTRPRRRARSRSSVLTARTRSRW